MIKSINEFKQMKNEASETTKKAVLEILNALSAQSDDKIIEDSKKESERYSATALEDHYNDPDFCARLVDEFRNDLAYAQDDLDEFVEFVMPVLSIVLNDNAKMAAAVSGYANGGEIDEYVN